jgi:competence protein ComEA
MEPPDPVAGVFSVQPGLPPPATAALPSPAAPAAGVATPWPRRVQWATATLLVLAAVLLVIHAVIVQAGGSRPAALQRGDALTYRVDLNKAKRAELLQLPGIGPTLAERIEQYRAEHGGFASVEELTKVRGIGPATLQRVRPFVCVGDESEDGDHPEMGDGKPVQRTSAYPPSPGGKKKTMPTSPIDVNRATQAELRQLPGIGPVLSQRILDTREARPFAKVDDLRRVPGIGPKTLEKLRPWVTVGE